MVERKFSNVRIPLRIPLRQRERWERTKIMNGVMRYNVCLQGDMFVQDFYIGFLYFFGHCWIIYIFA